MPKKLSHPHKIPWYRDQVKRGYILQIFLIIVTVWVLANMIDNSVTNLANRGTKTSFAFMSEISTFAVPLNFYPFWEFTLGKSTYLDIFIIGVQNTLLIGILGIPAATILGTVIGILRLSPNVLVRSIVSAYIEIFRNTPILLQLLFWGFAVFPSLLNLLPPVKDSLKIGNTVINSAGIYMPAIIFNTTGIVAVLTLLIAIVAAIWYLCRHGKRQFDRTGHPYPVFIYSLGIIIVAGVIFYFFISGLLVYDYPVKQGLNYRGGFRPPNQLLILWFGLVLYTAAFIAENVRGGILAVSHGQSEAAMALGLRRGERMRLIILPQALRVIIPPTISQFLNLVKNSSLAVAIGYPDLNSIWTGIALNQTGQALIIIAMTVLVYECISLFTSWLSNIYNASVQIKEI